MHGLRLDFICVISQYLVDITSLNRHSRINICRFSLNGKISPPISKAGCDVNLHATLIIQMALV